MPGMPGMPGGRGKPAKQVKQAKRTKRTSGNPAKRAALEQAASLQQTEAAEAALADFELPDAFKGLLPPT